MKQMFKGETLPREMQAGLSGLLSPVSNSTNGNARVPKSDIRRLSVTCLARKRLRLLLKNPLTASEHLHNSLSGGCCSLLFRINVIKQLAASCRGSEPSVGFEIVMVL